MSEKLQDNMGNANVPPDGSDGQKALFGIGAGFLAMAAGVTLWILLAKKYQLTWMSLAVAFGIASAIRYAGKTKDMWYGIVGAVFALIAAVTGNLATIVFMAAQNYNKSPGEIAVNLDAGTAFFYLSKYSGALGVVFYLATAAIGFWFAFGHAVKRPLDLPE